MRAYTNKNGDSGVTYYAIGEDYIDIKFKKRPDIYRYPQSIIGKDHFDIMKQLAIDGKGLSTYINKNAIVRDNYEKL